MQLQKNLGDEQCKVLIIDDEPEILSSLSRAFQLDNIPVQTCGNPIKALDLMMQNRYLIVLTDIKMPGMDGIELLQALKSINPLCNIIMMTEHSNMRYVVDCLSQGACDYFAKPFIDLNILVDAVKTAITRINRWKKGIGVETRSA